MTQYSSRSTKPSGLNKSQCHVTYSCTPTEIVRCWQKCLYSKGADKRTETSWWSFSGLEGQVWRSHWAPVAPGWVKWKLLSHVRLCANSPGQNTGVGRLSLLQGIFPTHRSNPGLPHRRQILYQLSHKRSPRIPEWVAYPFSGGSSWPRNPTKVSCVVGGVFTNWAIREAWYTLGT